MHHPEAWPPRRTPSSVTRLLIILGFLILSHRKHGCTKNHTYPNVALNNERGHHGHALFILLVYLDSMRSNIGIPSIWNELTALIITNKLVSPSNARDTSRPWNAYGAVSIPPFAGICQIVTPYILL